MIVFGDGKSIPNRKIEEISTELSWEGAAEKEIESGAFSGSVLYDKRLPYSEDDFIYDDPENGIIVLMDGVVYNHEEISRLINGSPGPLRHPQLVSQAFLKWGPEFVSRLNGDFAICIYQKKNNRVYFFRDHLGIRPLAVSESDSAFYFASDGRALGKVLYRDEKVDHDYLYNQFLFAAYDYTKLPHKHVNLLKFGHWLQVDSQGSELIRYWEPEKIKKDDTLDQDRVLDDLDLLVRDAVKIRSDKRFTAGAHVSGGIDSGIVAALARKEYSEQETFFGYPWTPLHAPRKIIEKIEFDERKLIESLCSLNNITPCYTDYSVEDYLVNCRRFYTGLIMEKNIQETAKANRTNLIFSGWGGDDFISMGHRGIDADLIREFDWAYFFKKYSLLRPKQFLSALLFGAIFPTARRQYVKYKFEPEIYPYIKDGGGSNLIPQKERDPHHSRRKVHLFLIEKGHISRRTMDWHLYGKTNGIEYRYPLLDKRIVEYMLKVPSRCLVGGEHYRIILRKIGKELLPENVLKNKSKSDPVNDSFRTYCTKQLIQQIINEFNEIRKIPDLDFIDFDLLEKDLHKKTVQESDILFSLQRAQTIIKKYNS